MEAKIKKVQQMGPRLVALTEITTDDGKRAVAMIPLDHNTDDASFKEAVNAVADQKFGRLDIPPPSPELETVKEHFESKIGQIINID